MTKLQTKSRAVLRGQAERQVLKCRWVKFIIFIISSGKSPPLQNKTTCRFRKSRLSILTTHHFTNQTLNLLDRSGEKNNNNAETFNFSVLSLLCFVHLPNTSLFLLYFFDAREKRKCKAQKGPGN